MKEDKLKQEIENILDQLKGKGFSRDAIEKELGYSENYIDQQLSKGGNRRFLNAIKGLNDRILQKAILPKPTTKALSPEDLKRKQSLEKSIENLTENELRTTAIIERLMDMLEGKQYDPSLNPTNDNKARKMKRARSKKPGS